MVTVPTKKTTEVRVGGAPAVFQSTNVPRGAFGTGGQGLIEAGRQLSSAGDRLSKLAIQAQQDDNDAEIKEKDNLIAETISEGMYGDGSEENQGYYGLKRKSALDNYGSTEDAMRKAVEDIINTSSNEAVKQRLGELSNVRMLKTVEGMTKHANSQRVAYHDEVSTARKAQAMSDTALNWNDDSFLQASIALMTRENEDFARRHDLSSEVKDAKLLEDTSAAVKATFDAAIANDAVTTARSIMTKYKDKVDGAILADMEKALDTSENTVKSQTNAALLRSKYPGDYQKQIEEAKKISDAEVQDATVKRLDIDYQRDQRIKREQERVSKREAWEVVKEQGVDALSTEQIASLDGTTMNSMLAFEKRKAKQGNGFALATDPVADNELHEMFMNDRLAFAEVNLLQGYSSKLDEGRYKYWQAQQRAINVREERDAKKEADRKVNYTLADRIAKEYLRSAGINFNAKKGDDPRKAQVVLDIARTAADEALEQGSKLDRKELEKLLSGVFLSGELQGSGVFFDDTGRAFEFFGREDEGYFEITDIEDQKLDIAKATGIPAKFVKGVADGLSKLNQPVTLENMVGLYEDYLASQGN